MAINFPTSLDSLSNPAAGDATNNLTTPHATQHANINDIGEALEAKVGIGASTPIANRLLRGTGTGTSAWEQIVLGDLASSVYGDTTYTPVLAGDSTAGSHTYSQQVGAYITIGGLVVAFFNVVLSTKDGSMAGNVYISLPVASRNVTNLIAGALISSFGNVDFTAGYSQLTSYILPNESRVRLSHSGDNVAGGNIVAAAISSSTFIRGVAIYPV